MAGSPLFEIDDLHVSANGTEILRGVNLTVGVGEVHALMGPNGSDKSTLANALLGSPQYEITQGTIRLRGDDITTWGPDQRFKAGIFLAFQNPESVAGVSVVSLLRQAMVARNGIDRSVAELRLAILEWMQRLDMDPCFADRSLNEGFSEDEKQRNEILQMAILEPAFAVLDGTDSGLEIDALSAVAQGVREVQADRPELGLLVVTDHRPLLDEISPTHVHVLVDGCIVDSGGMGIADGLEAESDDGWRLPVAS